MSVNNVFFQNVSNESINLKKNTLELVLMDVIFLFNMCFNKQAFIMNCYKRL